MSQTLQKSSVFGKLICFTHLEFSNCCQSFCYCFCIELIVYWTISLRGLRKITALIVTAYMLLRDKGIFFSQQCSSKVVSKVSGCHKFAWWPLILVRNHLCRWVADMFRVHHNCNLFSFFINVILRSFIYVRWTKLLSQDSSVANKSSFRQNSFECHNCDARGPPHLGI